MTPCAVLCLPFQKDAAFSVSFSAASSFRLGGLCLLLGFQSLLAIASDHDEAEEAADDSAAEEEEDDGDANGPDARREEGLEGMRLVDEGLDGGGQQVLQAAFCVARLTSRRVQMV